MGWWHMLVFIAIQDTKNAATALRAEVRTEFLGYVLASPVELGRCKQSHGPALLCHGVVGSYVPTRRCVRERTNCT
jgi:hypothetical protein